MAEKSIAKIAAATDIAEGMLTAEEKQTLRDYDEAYLRLQGQSNDPEKTKQKVFREVPLSKEVLAKYNSLVQSLLTAGGDS